MIPYFRTDPNFSYEEKRRIAGDNYLEMTYDMEKLERAKSAEELEEWFKQLENRMKNRENK